MDRPESPASAAATALVGSALTHHGVKGMKWGVRRDQGHEGERAKNTKIAKLDKKFEKNASKDSTFWGVYNKAAHAMNSGEIDRINNLPRYKDVDLTKDPKLMDRYEKDMAKSFTTQLEKAAGSYGLNASGTKTYAITTDQYGNWDVTTVDVKHDDESFTVTLTRDSTGKITAIEMPDDMAQGIVFDNGVLIHYGVKGMHWGVRRGERPPPSEDHLRTEAHRETIKSGGLKALSNADLKKVNERMQLEQQYKDLKNKKPSKYKKGKQVVNEVLGLVRTGNDIHNILNGPLAKAVKKSAGV